MPYTKAQAKEKITKLVEDFRAHERTLERAPEAEIENSFIRPLFEALNWNTTNQGLSYAQYEFKVQATNKKGLRPDYILHVDGRDVLVMDAKQVKYSMRDPRWLYQVYSYAYSTQNSKPSEKIDFAILTDFQEFIVLDCTLYAAKPEAVNNFRVIDWKYTDYVEQFDTLWDLFERHNVLNASRPHDGRGAVIAPDDKPIAPKKDKTNTPTEQDSSADETGSVTQAGVPRPYGLWAMYLSPQKVKANRVPPDKAFLAQMDDEKDGWRVLLAKDMKKRNPRADGELITAAVQLLIDRLIFIKALSDREVDRDYLSEIESRVTEAGLGEDEAGWFASCKHIFDELNNFYNGSIFEPRPELENVSVGNRAVQAVLHDLQPENSPYNFAVLPVEILGTIYERFLGRVVRTTDKRVTIEDKPEVRKAGGVYYTPQYIVDYIVENTLGKLLANCKTPADVAQLKILDPSCGSGSFLLGAYSKLIDWHKDYYARAGKEKRDRASFYRDEGGLIRLTAKLKRDILKNNLYGVDIDPQAVEVTRFSLSLKALEDLREGELTEERTLFHQTVLPDLSGNIKNGNSLIGTDYFGLIAPTAEELKEVKPFNWNIEFKEIMDNGGFDCIIGNPPWGAEFTESQLEYHRQQNRSIIVRMIDSFMYFVYQFSKRTANNGYFGMILPDVVLYQSDNTKIREYLLNNFQINLLLNMGNVFEQVTRPASILVFQISQARDYVKTIDVSNLSKSEKEISIKNDELFFTFEQNILKDIPGYLFVTANPERYSIWNKVKLVSHTRLDEVVDNDGIQRGVSPDLKKAFLINAETVKEYALESDKIRRVVTGGKQVKKYFISYPDLWVIYTNDKDNFKKLPNIRSYIDQFKEEITCKEVLQGKHSIYALHRPRREDIFIKPEKMLGVITEDEIIIAPDTSKIFATDGLYLFGLKEGYKTNYILGILNSKLMTFVYRLLASETGRVLAQVKPTTLGQLPIRTLDLSKPDEKAQHDKMVALVEQMLSLHKSKAEAQTQSAIDAYERQIRAVDESIDKLVYQLYGLTPEEVKIVEG